MSSRTVYKVLKRHGFTRTHRLGLHRRQGLCSSTYNNELKNIPFIMETPIYSRRDDDGNLKKCRELAKKAVRLRMKNLLLCTKAENNNQSAQHWCSDLLV